MNIEKIRKNFLSHEETDSRAKLVLDAILAISAPVSVVLFGSAARYELTSSSDIDVVVVLQSVSELKEARKRLYAKSGELPFSVDFLVVDKDTYVHRSQIGGALFDARHEGKILFEQTID